MELLTAKPVLYLANTDEGLVPPEGLAAHAEAQGGQALALPVGMELELAEMDPAEAAELAAELELGDVARRRRRRGRRLPAARPGHLLHRLGPARGARLAGAAGNDRLGGGRAASTRTSSAASSAPRSSPGTRSSRRARSRAPARRRLLRMEGRDYVVQEGDVLQIRFNV